MVDVGLTDRLVPDLVAPSMATELAFATVQSNVVPPPYVIVLLSGAKVEMLAAGTTVTIVVAVTVAPAELAAVSV